MMRPQKKPLTERPFSYGVKEGNPWPACTRVPETGYQCFCMGRASFDGWPLDVYCEWVESFMRVFERSGMRSLQGSQRSFAVGEVRASAEAGFSRSIHPPMQH